ncbi:MAG: hypothetical protein OXU61_09180 [Gammaproteobacteria bacterium]|nr:hypothetical protein [Gammaproteobacteria bacterium]
MGMARGGMGMTGGAREWRSRLYSPDAHRAFAQTEKRLLHGWRG